MGKFTGTVLCSDIDGTLIDSKLQISKENREAIRYFRSEGGLFTLATGRVPGSAKLYADVVKPDLPIICQNGCGIFDYEKNDYLWTMPLDQKVAAVVDEIVARFPFVGVEIITAYQVYFCRENARTQMHKEDEHFPDLKRDFRQVPEPWIKVLFAQEADETQLLKRELEHSPYQENYKFVQSHRYYFEIFHKDANKGSALRKLAELMEIPLERFVAVGDNDNDLELIQTAGKGVCVQNASAAVKQAAQLEVTDHNHSALADLIAKL